MSIDAAKRRLFENDIAIIGSKETAKASTSDEGLQEPGDHTQNTGESVD